MHIPCFSRGEDCNRHGCVRPGILPASINVAPNSPSARAKARTVPAITPGPASGKSTRRKTAHSLAPSVRAACRSEGFTWSNAPSVVRYIRGNAITVAAITVAGHENAIESPTCSRARPMKLRLPKISRRKKPTTVGGSTKGRVRSPSIHALKAAAHVVHDPCRDHPQKKRGHGRSTSRSQRNDQRRRISRQDHGAASVYPFLVKIALAAALPETLQMCARHPDSRSSLPRPPGRRLAHAQIPARSHHANPAGDLCIGRIHKARIRVARFHESQHLANIFAQNELSLHLVVQVKGIQSLLRILPSGYARGIANRNNPNRSIGQPFGSQQLRIKRRNQDQRIVQNILPIPP